MRRDRFAELLAVLQSEEAEVNQTKGEEYSGPDDALANFKRISGQLAARGMNVSPELVCMVYLQKHLDSIYSYVAGRGKPSEPIRGRIVDARLYLALLYALIVERESSGVSTFDRDEP